MSKEMTREEAYKLAMKACEETWNEDVCDKIKDALSAEPCSDSIAKERYEDLCEYFGDAKDILKSREEFKKWLDRVKWHIRKAEELYEKSEHKTEPCSDAISRQAALNEIEYHTLFWNTDDMRMAADVIRDLPPVHAEPRTGHWKPLHDWWVSCSECGYETTHDLVIGASYCPNCGSYNGEVTKMEEQA